MLYLLTNTWIYPTHFLEPVQYKAINLDKSHGLYGGAE